MVTIALTNNQKTADTGIEAPFLGNHDTSRYVGSVSGRKIANNAKFALGLLQQLKGSTFTYYGDEVGMGSQGTDQDGFYRLPLRWGDDYTTKIGKIGGLYGVGSEKDVDESLCYPHKTVAEQEKDSNSILNYAKKANLIRLQFPEIARGTFEEKYSEGSALAVIKRTYKGSTIHIAINASKTETKQIDYSLYGENVVAELCTSGNIRLTAVGETKINIPPQSIAIIR
jgi:glycosidase